MLTTRKRRALRLLMESSPELAAALAGVRTGTLRRWMADPEFAGELSRLQAECRQAAARVASTAALAAAQKLGDAIRTGEDRGLSRHALDILKISGVFDEAGVADDALAQLAAVIERCERAAGGQ